ncbi:MAG: prolipoprotein diacylglyceryl transferase family protein, partial [Chloroflexota bacterium]
MFPILFRTEFGFIYTFTAVWLVGLFGCILIIWWQDKEFTHWDHLLAGVVGALLLGRVQFVLQNGEWFAENPAERWSIFQGGHGYAGTVLGAAFGLLIITLAKRTNFRQTITLLALTVGPLHFVGWLACWFDGCGYGLQAFIGWYAAELPNNFGLMAVRYRTQVAGILSAAVFTLLLVLVRRRITGRWLSLTAADFWLSLACLAAVRGIIYPWQGDIVP